MCACVCLCMCVRACVRVCDCVWPLKRMFPMHDVTLVHMLDTKHSFVKPKAQLHFLSCRARVCVCLCVFVRACVCVCV